MNEHPILFSTPMVQAILAGRKTMTRRVVKPQPRIDVFEIDYPGRDEFVGKNWVKAQDYRYREFALQCPVVQSFKCPYGKVGDVLWVRESFLRTGVDSIRYKADTPDIGGLSGKKWKPSIHMPKAGCRIFLEIISIKVERLHDITEADAMAEGVNPINPDFNKHDLDNGVIEPAFHPVKSFKSLWQKINGRESWDNNPFVWVVEFKRISKP